MNEKYILIITYFFVYMTILINQILLPEVSRKDILLGVKIPENKRKDKKLKELIKGYKYKTFIIGLLTSIILLYINYTYIENIELFLINIFIYIIILFLVYLNYNKKIKEIKSQKNWIDLAVNIKVIDISNMKKNRLDIIKYISAPIILFFINLIIIQYNFNTIPNKIPTKFNFNGEIIKSTSKNIISANYINIIQIFLIVCLYIVVKLIDKSKGKVDYYNIERSKENVNKFKIIWIRYTYYLILFLQLLMSYINLYIIGIFSEIKFFNYIMLIYLLVVLISAIVISIKYGQSGDRIDRDFANYYNMEDDKYWFLGNTIYKNKEDPNLFIEKRVGVGWTINLGHLKGKIIFYLPFILLIMLTYIMNRRI